MAGIPRAAGTITARCHATVTNRPPHAPLPSCHSALSECALAPHNTCPPQKKKQQHNGPATASISPPMPSKLKCTEQVGVKGDSFGHAPGCSWGPPKKKLGFCLHIVFFLGGGDVDDALTLNTKQNGWVNLLITSSHFASVLISLIKAFSLL